MDRRRLSAVSGCPYAPDASAFDREKDRVAVLKLTDPTDPWSKLAAAYAVNGLNDEALAYFSRALQQAGDYEARKSIVAIASRLDGVLSALIKRHPDDPQLQLAFARKRAERGKQHLAEKQPAKAQAQLEQSCAMIARLRGEPRWSVLTPTEMKSDLGAKMDLQKDGSVFVHQGESAGNDTYTLVFPSRMKGIKGLRLEALADSRLPNGGPGWKAGYGNFVLSELTLQAAPAGSPDQPRPIALRNASADFSGTNLHVGKAIDGDDDTGWAINPELNKDHTALFDLADEVGDGQGSRLTVRLRHRGPEPGYNLGRFRLSVTDDAATMQATRIRQDLKDGEAADLNVALGKAHAQQGHTKEAVASFTEALALAADRAGKARIIAEAAPLAGVLEKLAERAAGDARFQAELARHFAEHGKAPAADAARAKARTLFEEKLAKEPEDSAWAVELPDLLLPRGDSWTVLRPLEIKSANGSQLELQNDGSIFVSQPANNDTYSLTFQTELKGIKGLRLEALADPRLPNGGPGFAGGNFVLSELTLQAGPAKIPDQPKSIALRNASADFSQQDCDVGRAIDGIGGTGWAVSPEYNKAHSAVFETAEDVGDGQPTRLTVRLSQQYSEKFLLGRFRLSVSADPATLDRERNRFAIVKIADPWAKLAAAYHVVGDQPAVDKLIERHPAAAAGIGEMYAARQNWKRAIAEFTRAIAAETNDAWIFAARAEAHEKLEHWELAAADWGNADLHASDKKGNPASLYMVRRARNHGRLKQYDKQVRDYTESLKPDRLGDNPWTFAERGEAYERLRQWDKVQADYERAIEICTPRDRGYFHYRLGTHFAARGQWKRAAAELNQANRYPSDFYSAWYTCRDAAMIYAMAEDRENCKKAALDCYGKRPPANANPDHNRWIVFTMLQIPGLITNKNRAELLERAAKTDPDWQPRLTAAIRSRCGDYEKAAELFDANAAGGAVLVPGGNQPPETGR